MTSFQPTLPPEIILEILTSPTFDNMFIFFNLLRCTTIDRTWRNIIYTTKSLRASLFLEPHSPPQALSPMTHHVRSSWNYSLHRTGYQPLTITSIHFHLENFRAFIHPIFDAKYDDRGKRADFAIPPALKDYPGGLFAWVRETQSDESVWWDMFVTAPPTMRMGFTVCRERNKPETEWWDEFKEDDVLVDEWWYERAEGVRIRDVVRMLCEEELPEACRVEEEDELDDGERQNREASEGEEGEGL